jgi:hypothetical protein
MDTFTLCINTPPGAFGDTPSGEIARLLRNLADLIETGDYGSLPAPIIDTNGNRCGHWDLDQSDSYLATVTPTTED